MNKKSKAKTPCAGLPVFGYSTHTDSASIEMFDERGLARREGCVKECIFIIDIFISFSYYVDHRTQLVQCPSRASHQM
jgi:hypothetical protein